MTLEKQQTNQKNVYSCCPSPDCPYVYEVAKDWKSKEFKNVFECPVCDHSYCNKCKKEYNLMHQGRECAFVDLPIVE